MTRRENELLAIDHVCENLYFTDKNGTTIVRKTLLPYLSCTYTQCYVQKLKSLPITYYCHLAVIDH